MEYDSWPVIGHVVGNTPHPFNGVYDGANWKIYGLLVGTRGEDEEDEPVGVDNEDAGLFGHVGETGVIRRVHVVDCQVYNKALYVGGIAGRNEGLVEYCSSEATDPDHSSGIVKGSWQYAGGIVGYNFGIISYCYSECDVIGAQKVGGITGGQNGGTVVNCYFRGYVYVYANDITRAYAGGIAGENDGNSTIDNCYSDGLIEGANNNAYCGGIAGSNDTGSTVGNCFWEGSEETGLSGIGSGSGDVNNVEQRTSEEFASGQVAWELAQGTNGKGWGQNMEGGITEDGAPYEKDKHPHFVGAPDKSIDTTPVYRVTFKYYVDAKEYDFITYVDPNVDVKEPPLPELEGAQSQWYEFDENAGTYEKGENGMPKIYNGVGITSDENAVAGRRINFTRPEEDVTVDMIYSPEDQKVDLDKFAYYTDNDDRNHDTAGNLEYLIDGNFITEVYDESGYVFVPGETPVGEYNVTVVATEKAPFIAPLPDGSADEIIKKLKNHEYDDYLSGTPEEPTPPGEYTPDSVTLKVKIIIGKATPVIAVRPTAEPIEYGVELKSVTLDGGKAVHPTTETETKVDGRFEWTSPEGVVPSINEAAITGYSVTFYPTDVENYNTNVTFVTMTVNKSDSTVITPPTANDLTYDGTAQFLITDGSADGGTMKYWLTDDPEAVPGEDAEFSSTIPARANVGTYYIWYKVIGDDNHNDTDATCVEATISPYKLNIPAQSFTYNGGKDLSVTLPGVNNETVTVKLTAHSANRGEYSYGVNGYTAEILKPNNANYEVDQSDAGILTINPLPVVLEWSKELVFEHKENVFYEVTATVTNKITGDDITLTYAHETGYDINYYNRETNAGNYVAKVIGLSNGNYTLDDAFNVEQAWHIVKTTKPIEFDPKNPKYGEGLTLNVNIKDSIPSDTVSFYANGQFLGQSTVDFNGDAILVVSATSKNNLLAGYNALLAVYEGDNNTYSNAAGATIYVSPKEIFAHIKGPNTKIYDGDNIANLGLELLLNGVEVCDIDYVIVSADSFTYDSADAGNKTITANNVTLSGSQSGNYVLSDKPVTTSGSITPKPVKLEWRGTSERVYDGNPSNVTATATELIPGYDCAVEVDNGDQINAGSYTAEAVSLDNSNYALPETDRTKEYSIAKAPLYLPELIVNYNGTCYFEEEVDGVTLSSDETEKVTVKLTTSGSYRGQYVYVPGDSADGEYTYIASAENGNYTIAGGALVIIEMGVPDITPPDGKELTYNGKAQKLIVEGHAVHGTILYSRSEEGPYSEDIPVGTEPGTYTIWYEVLGDEGYVDLDPKSVTATITKPDVSSSGSSGNSSGSGGNSSGSGGNSSVNGVCPRDNTCPIWPYTDASTTAWYHDGVHYCIEKGLIEGYGNWIFGPGNPLSRAMLAQIIYNHVGRPKASGSSPFDDVKKEAWYADAVIWAADNGVVEGYGNGKFGPNDPITREQLAAMLYRYEQSQGGGFKGSWMFRMDFNDLSDISDWAYEAISWCNMNGVIVGKGDGVLDPRGNATRAEAATMIMRYFELNK